MRVLLVKPYSHFPTRIPHLGLGYLATALRQAKHTPLIADCTRERINGRGLVRLARESAAEVIGISMFSADLPVVADLIPQLRRALPDARLILGGPHPTALPCDTLRQLPEVDYIVAGEAELSLPRLLEQLASGPVDGDSIPGLAWRESGQIRTSLPRWETDLDSLGFPAWDLLGPELYRIAPHGAFVRQMPVAPIITTRGCPYPCTFCAARVISGVPLRARSIGHVLDEIDLLIRRHGIREIHIEDDNFTARRNYVLEFCEGVSRRFPGLSWCCPNGVRLDTLDAELLAAMRRSGCYSLSLGIESGCDPMLKTIQKKLETAQVREKVELIHSVGLKTTGFFIIGLPDESEEQIRQTVRFARSLPLDHAQFSVFLPLPGTVHFDSYVQKVGLEAVPWKNFYTTDPVQWPGGIPIARLRRLQRRAFFAFYFRPRVVLNILRKLRGPRHFWHLLRRAIAIFKPMNAARRSVRAVPPDDTKVVLSQAEDQTSPSSVSR
jgi:radical SAM superfamily enzyme YgiQ (UPF0313 family)